MKNNNYYEEVLTKVDGELSKQNYAKALDILVEELNMPYVPQPYENRFRELAMSIQYQLQDQKPGASFSMDQILDMISSDNENEQIIALELLKNQNLRPHTEEMKNRIETFDKPIKQAILFEILASQEISTSIKIGDKIMNPIDDSIMKNQEVINAFNLISNNRISTPQITQGAMGELNRYLLTTFPAVPKDGNKLASDIIAVVSHIITGSGDLTTEQNIILEILSQQ